MSLDLFLIRIPLDLILSSSEIFDSKLNLFLTCMQKLKLACQNQLTTQMN